MKIGIVGAGSIGQALAVRFAAAGHDVMLSNSRGPETLAAVIAAFGGSVRAGSVPEAARFGDVVAIAIPPRALRDLPAGPFAGKIVIDVNNYYPEHDGPFPELDGSDLSSSQALASLLPGARVVKAFNTLYFERLLHDSRPDLPAEQRIAVPVAADDADAARTVAVLVDEIGFTPVDAGSLADSHRQQPGTSLYEAYRQARIAGATITASQLGALLTAQLEHARRVGSGASG
jgi:8-hydroxy-5-deazaflavin:NADPH oxidoreductase